jgi:transposase
MGVFIGLDVSLSKTAVCLVDREGVVLWQGKVSSEPGPLVARLAEWSGTIDLAGIEACPLSEWLHRGLREAGISPWCASRPDMPSAFCLRARSRPTEMTPVASPR